MCMLCRMVEDKKMTFREVGRALGEFKVEPEHEKELQQIILENFSLKDIAENLEVDIEEIVEDFAQIDFSQFGDVDNK